MTNITIDAKGRILGRVASEAATILRGKNSPTFEPHILPDTRVIIVNARHIRLSGNKRGQKTYTRYSGYPSGLKEISFTKLFQEDPRRVLEHAIKGMLPKNKLSARILRRRITIHNDEHAEK